MKPSSFKQRIMTLAVLLTAVSFTAAAEEISKDYHKEITPEPNSTLNISNKFGDVVTETWAENRIVVDVKVTVEHSSAEKAKRMMDMIDVKFTQTNGNLTAETVFDEDFSSSNWGGDNNHFSIDYSIKMPANVNLTIINKYGNADIDDLTSLVNIDLKYGNLYAGKLTRGNVKPINNLTVAYGKAEVDELNWAEINSRYCGQFKIENATALLIDSKYSKLSLGDVSSVVCESKYDGYDLGNVNNFVAVAGYTNIKIESVSKKIDVQTKYGNLIVESIPAGFDKISISSGYCTVKLAINPSACYNLQAESKYGGIKIDDSNFDPTTRIIGNTNSEVSGKVGKCQNPTSNVTISASYGSVTLY
jgi:hypothetical protein